MHGIRMILWKGIAVSLALIAAPSCRKPDEAVKSDLKEAGYQLTNDDWMRAARGNDVSALKKFIEGGFSPDTRDAAGDSALHVAAGAGSQEAADYLMDRGLSVDLPGASGRTPLMAAVAGDRTAMVRWFLRQGADPRARDLEDFSPLMLAVREGRSGSVAELAPYHREMLDPAILLASLVGQTDVIDTLTNYGASVYARMEDGRTPLMIAAENGHRGSVELLLDIGSSRLSTDAEGRSAADLAAAAGHEEIAALIARDPLPDELTLETPEEIARSMDEFVDTAIAESVDETLPADNELSQTEPVDAAGSSAVFTGRNHAPSRPIQGEVLSNAVVQDASAVTGGRDAGGNAVVAGGDPVSENPVGTAGDEPAPFPPLVMRYYREREVPVQVTSVSGESATLDIRGSTTRAVTVQPGQPVPGSRLVVVQVQRRMEDSKLTQGEEVEVSVVEVRDTATGETREWISGVPSSAHDPVALIEDAATGQRYTATPGQRFTSSDGVEFIISDVRPNQIIIENAATGSVQTLPLRGPRG